MAANIKDAHRRLSGQVMGRPGVVGTAIGMASGKPCLTVYVAREGDGAKTRLPHSFEGYRVVVERTGTFRRLSS